MTAFSSPGLGFTSGFTNGEDGWGDDYNAMALQASVVTQGKVLDRVTDLPGSPTHGDIYMLTGTDDSNSVGDINQIAAYYVQDAVGHWVYFTPQEGWSFWVVDEQARYEYRSGGWTIVSSGTNPIDIGLFMGGTLSSNELVAQFVATRAFNLPVDFADAQAYAGSGDDTDLELSIQKNGAEFGTVTLSADSNSGYVAMVLDSTSTNFVAGDILSVVAPASPGLWADISLTLAGTRS